MRPAMLMSACQRISESLDLDTVLCSTSERTGARSSAIATTDETGRFQDISALGLSPEEEQRRRKATRGVGPGVRACASCKPPELGILFICNKAARPHLRLVQLGVGPLQISDLIRPRTVPARRRTPHPYEKSRDWHLRTGNLRGYCTRDENSGGPVPCSEGARIPDRLLTGALSQDGRGAWACGRAPQEATIDA